MAPIVDEFGRTPLDTALFNSLFGHSKALLEAYIDNDVSCLASLKKPLKILATKYPGLMADFLGKCAFPAQTKHTRIPIDAPILSCSENVASPWNKRQESDFIPSHTARHKVRVPAAAFILGFPHFLAYDGPFHQIVKKGSLSVFETEVMQRAIKFKWQTYGAVLYTVQSFTYLSITVIFSTSAKMPTLFPDSPQAQAGGEAWLFLNGICIFITCIFFFVEVREFLEDGVAVYLGDFQNYVSAGHTSV